jgi:hypothetical protein
MKIAVCFSGMIRTGVHTADLLKTWFGNAYSDMDFFVHTWDITSPKEWFPNSIKRTSGEIQVIDREVSYPILEELAVKYDNRIKSTLVENFDSFSFNYGNQYPHFSPLWYSWYKSILLKTQYEQFNGFKYDLVIKLRPDVIFDLRYPFENFLSLSLENPDIFYVNHVLPQRIDDIFFMSSSDIMNAASDFIMKNKNINFCNSLLISHLAKHKITTKSMGFVPYAIYRPEHISHGISPYKFGKCFNMERDYYAPCTTVDRIPEDE